MKTRYVINPVPAEEIRTLRIVLEQNGSDIFMVLTDGTQRRRLVGVRGGGDAKLSAIRWASPTERFEDAVEIDSDNRIKDMFPTL